MNLKRLKILSLILFAGGLVFTACQDTFDEEDFLNKQYSLDTAQQSQQLEAFNEAGKLLSFTVQVLEDESPVPDVAVTISNASGTGTITVNTNSNGLAVFSDVAMGGNTVIISKTDYITASVNINFGNPVSGTNYTTVAGRIIPIKLNSSLQLPIFAKGAGAGTGSTATIKGRVTIETDVTNNTPEAPPTGTTIRANFNATPTIVATGVTAPTVANYFFTEGNLGVATTAADGTYSMFVPASSDGMAITLDIPTIEGVQKIAVNTVNDVDNNNDGPEVREDVPTVWGPGLTYDAIPGNIPGAKAVFTPGAPPVAGRGFDVTTIDPVGRSLDAGTINDVIEDDFGDIIYTMDSRGLDFAASPKVDINGVGTTDDAETTLRGYVKTITITGGGTGYPASSTLRVHLGYNDGADKILPSPAGGVFVTVTTDASGTITTTGSITLPASAGFIGNGTAFVTGEDVASFKPIVTNTTNVIQTFTTAASIAIDQTNELASVRIVNTGSNLTTVPTLTFSTGTASVKVLSMPFQWELKTFAAATTPYKILPSDIEFIWESDAYYEAFTETTAQIDVHSPIGALQSSGVDFIDNLKVDAATGNLVKREAINIFRTDNMWPSKPKVHVVDATIQTPKATVDIDATGQVTGLTVTNSGAGFDVPLTVAITPFVANQGSGAVIQLDIDGDSFTREQVWSGGYTIKSPGSGYNELANPKVIENFSAPTVPNVKVGNTYIIDIKYGTGDKREKID